MFWVWLFGNNEKRRVWQQCLFQDLWAMTRTYYRSEKQSALFSAKSHRKASNSRLNFKDFLSIRTSSLNGQPSTALHHFDPPFTSLSQKSMNHHLSSHISAPLLAAATWPKQLWDTRSWLQRIMWGLGLWNDDKIKWNCHIFACRATMYAHLMHTIVYEMAASAYSFPIQATTIEQ